MLAAFLFAALIGRLIYIEVITSSDLQAKAMEQWMRDVPLQAERGEIYDRNGVLLADSETVYTVYARPMSVSNKAKTASILAETLGLDKETVYSKLHSRISEITIAKKVTKEEMLKLYNSEATGLYYSQTISRVYPYGDFMTQILGFTNLDAQGQTGVEAYYDKYLSGTDGYLLTETDLVGRELDTGVTRYVAGKKGNSVYLTLDYYIQSFAEKAVDAAMINHKALGASAIVMNAKTGEIYAMAQAPSFDLNNVPRDNIAELFSYSKSTLISNVFEPGSTFKILTAAIGLETGAISVNTACYCPGYRMVDGQKIRCWKTIGHGSQKFYEGVQNSCNCLFMDTALKIGSNRFYDYIYKFGLNEKTGIDFSGEGKGLLIPRADVKPVDLARIGFGQAIAVTPIALLRSAAAVVNGGNLVTPYILDRVEDTSGKITVKNAPSVKKGVISETTSATMRDVLESVVTNGSGRNASVAGYRIGGKTGTAQKYINGVIARGKYTSTFIGFAPADDPEYIVLMVVDEPQGLYYGSIVAAPYVGDIFRGIFAYKNISPAVTPEPVETFIMPNLIGMTPQQANAELTKLKIFVEIAGEEGIVVRQTPAAGVYVSAKSVAVLEIG